MPICVEGDDVYQTVRGDQDYHAHSVEVDFDLEQGLAIEPDMENYTSVDGGGDMDKIRLGLVGCGGMGTRHLYGLRELVQSPFSNVELCAVCDIRRENAELAALEAEKLMGVRPEIFTDLEQMARTVPDLTAVDVVTDPSVHHNVVCQALDLGLHVMVENRWQSR